MILPIFFSITISGLYNFRRFGSVFDTGYTRNVSVLDKNYYNYKLGWFSPVHIPANLYALLVMPPEPVKKEFYQFILDFPYFRANQFGMAIWFTSPLFFYLFMAKIKPYTFSAIITIAILLFPSLVYFGMGASQFGYRYSLDFLPLLFLMLLSAFGRGLTSTAKVLITAGIIFDSFYMASIWNSYPLLDFFNYLH